MGDTIVRDARAADAARIGLVHVRSWQGTYQGLMPQDYLDGLDPAQRTGMWERILAELEPARAGVLVAEVDRDILGFVSYSASRDDDADPEVIGEVQAIYLLPTAWGKGIGRRLMGAALGRLAGAGFTEATLWALDTNARARRFYEAGGWTTDGTVKSDDIRGFPLPHVRYRKALPGLV